MRVKQGSLQHKDPHNTAAAQHLLITSHHDVVSLLHPRCPFHPPPLPLSLPTLPSLAFNRPRKIQLLAQNVDQFHSEHQVLVGRDGSRAAGTVPGTEAGKKAGTQATGVGNGGNARRSIAISAIKVGLLRTFGSTPCNNNNLGQRVSFLCTVPHQRDD